MAIDPGRVKALFQAAIERDDLAERRAFLDREIGADTELRNRLDALLAFYDHPPGVLNQPLDADPQATIAADSNDARAVSPPSAYEANADDPTFTYRREEGPSPLDTVIAGRYKLRQEIGAGGMGSVYLAEQTRPVRRQVALKLIKAGMDSRTVLARFESERQALALMDHPNIAKVLDAGTTEQGRPFFVMELVKGIPLTEYCDRHRLSLPERLDLFRQICSAVQHAHQKGIIHRDLKPTNILVERHDEKPVPKVIDFGLAKATGGMRLTEQSLFSAFGTVAGTPLYMAPEQANFNAIDVDTRADVYALGVILYELLTGSTPIQRDTFKRAALDEMMRMIREDEPPTPSSRISSSGTLPNIAAGRQVEISRLGRFVRGDLDWIVMKALAKERQRRYDSPIALAQDIERFNNHEPVSAGPPTAAYRFKKFVRRNRGRVLAGSIVLLALVGGIVGTTLGLVEANRQKGIAVARRREAEKRLGQKDKANEILLSIFRDLDPAGGDKETLPLPDRLGKSLDAATAALEGEATDDPLGVARMQLALGESQYRLGYPEKAISLASKARATFTSLLGPENVETLTSMNYLATAYQDAGRMDLALPLLEETLSLRKSKLGPTHPDTLVSMNNLAVGYRADGKIDRALPLFKEALEGMKSKLGLDHPKTIANMNNLASAYQDAGRMNLALPLLEESLVLSRTKYGPNHLHTLTRMNNLALGYQAAGRLDRALPLLEETLTLMQANLGPDHPSTLSAMNNLAEGYRETGKNDRAMPLYEQTLALRKTKHGRDHPLTIASMNNLALGYMTAGRFDRARPLLEETVALCKSKLGADHPEALKGMNNLASAYEALGQLDRALLLHEQTLALLKTKVGPDHPLTLISMNNLAGAYRRVGQIDRGLSLREDTLARMRVKLGPDHPGTLKCMNSLAHDYALAGKPDRAIPLFEESFRRHTAKFGADHPDTWLTRANLGVVFKEARRPADALPLLEEAHRASRKYPALREVDSHLLEAYISIGQADKAAALAREMLAEGRAALPAGSLQLAALLAQTGSILLDVKLWAEAEPLLRECLAIREKAEPEAWTTFNTKSMIGAALLGQRKTTEATLLLRSGYEGMKQRADKIPPQGKPRLGEALDRLIELAESTDKPDDAKAWKDERAKLSADASPKPGVEKK